MSSPPTRTAHSHSSPIPHLLRTNRIPSELELQAIRESIATAQSDISQLDADIAHGIQEGLIEERDALQQYVNEHVAFLTPARRMPADIWSEIFLHCLPYGCTGKDFLTSGATEYGVFDLEHAPALLMRVCRDWTAIAGSHPKLWSFISLETGEIPVNRLPGPNLVQAWLRRSHEIQLSVIVTRSSRPAFDYFQRPAVIAVLEQSHRWQFARLSVPLFFLETVLPLKGNVPHLEELHLSFLRAGMNDSQPKVVDFLLDAPKLRRVTIHHPPPFPIVDLQLPWAQLTHFSHLEFNPEDRARLELSGLLQLVPTLVHVQWRFTEFKMDVMSDPSTVENSSLRDLSIICYARPGDTFDRLILPSLRTLSITAVLWDWSWLPLKSFLAHCQSLTTFTLASFTITGGQLVACLTALPSLTHFELSFQSCAAEVDTYETLFRALVWTEDTRDVVVLPRMRTIKIDCNRKFISDIILGIGQFVDMLESRWRMPLAQCSDHDSEGQPKSSRIKSATLLIRQVEDFASNPEDDGRLRRLKDQGLDVQVSLRKSGKSRHLV